MGARHDRRRKARPDAGDRRRRLSDSVSFTSPNRSRLSPRLQARAQSTLLRHQPEQHRDLLTAAGLIEQFADIGTEIGSAAVMADGLARGLLRLRDSMGGA